MKIEQIYTGCLAQGAYYISSNGEAAIIDPLREVEPYLERLKQDHVKLLYIFETHFHADFVSGHLDLQKKTGAQIIYGPNAKGSFDFVSATDGQIFSLGDVTFKILHTPGHTMESSCFLLMDEHEKNHSIYTGDTLFIGDVGRPDLAQKNTNLTQEQLASLLYHSLRDKIMTLADEVIIYPGHGAGSACGKNMSKEIISTIGHQKKFNYALRANMTEQEFIKEVTDGLLPPPGYFGSNVAMNKHGYDSFDAILKKGLREFSPDEFKSVAEQSGAMVLDTRNPEIFVQGFIPQSINIGLKGDFAPWVGALLVDVKQPLLLVTEAGKEEESITRLSRIGFDNVLGYLKGGIDLWKNTNHEIDTIKRITATEFASKVEIGKSVVFDIRRDGEFATEHVEKAYHRPLANINTWMKSMNSNEHFFIHCAGGYRSIIAASILQARGYRNFSEIEGGFKAIAETNIPRTNFVYQNKTEHH